VNSGNAAVNVISGSHSISAPLLLNDDTTFNIIPVASTLTVSNLTATGKTITKYGDGTLEVNRVRASALELNVGTVRITPAANPADSSANESVSVVPSLSLATGARLDLTNTKLITSVTPGTATGGVYSGIQGLVQSARNGGSWNGPGILTSQSDATNGNYTTLAVATASQAKNIAPTATAVWAGQTVTGSDTLVMYTYGGDANLDGKVNVDDYVRIDSNVGLNNATSAWFNGDFNYDGKVNVDDYVIIDGNIGIATTPFFSSDGSGGGDSPIGVISVPEPCAIPLLTCGAWGWCQSRRRRGAVRSQETSASRP
jgi:hypothetical protein